MYDTLGTRCPVQAMSVSKNWKHTHLTNVIISPNKDFLIYLNVSQKKCSVARHQGHFTRARERERDLYYVSVLFINSTEIALLVEEMAAR